MKPLSFVLMFLLLGCSSEKKTQQEQEDVVLEEENMNGDEEITEEEQEENLETDAQEVSQGEAILEESQQDQPPDQSEYVKETQSDTTKDTSIDTSKDTQDIPSTNKKVGDPCKTKAECPGGQNALCIPEVFSDGSPGWPNGYCTILNCEAGTCPSGSECFQTYDSQNKPFTLCLKTCTKSSDCNQGYVCPDFGACVPACKSDDDCGEDEVCGEDGQCVEKPCTPTSCGTGMKCENGKCVPDISGGPGPGPGPDCPNLPPKDCTGGENYCGEIILFEPLQGPGYDNYPINGECYPCPQGKGCNGYGMCTSTGKLPEQYRSYARRDLVMLVKWATAFVDCKAKNWGGGNGKPLGLGDMSESNGAIPGTSIGDPGHPQGTHTNGYDIDMAYYQNTGNDNYLKPVCEHTINGQEQYHCVKPPNILDLWRTALFAGALFTSNRTRVLGMDGKIGPLVASALPTLCANGWLPQSACNKAKTSLAYEETDKGYGWYYFHHHHMHLSLWPVTKAPSGTEMQCITPDCKGIHPGQTPIPQWDLYGNHVKEVKIRFKDNL